MSSLVELEHDARHRSALDRCTGDAGAFLSDTWGRRASFHRAADPTGFGDLLSFDDVDRILTTTSLRTPSFRLVKAGETIPESAYTRSGTTGSRPVAGMADPRRVFELFEQGATIVLQGLHRYWEPVARFARDLEVELGHPSQVNAYVTPAGAQGLELHDDPHDVFVLQTFGQKAWEIHAAPAETEREPIRTTIGPGDCVYMPTGTPHAASTQQSLSGHLTVGIHVASWRDVLGDLWKLAVEDVGLDDAVPARWHREPAAFADAVEERIAAAISGLRAVDARRVAEDRIERFLSTRPPLLRGGLIERTHIEQIREGTAFARRPGSVCELVLRDDRLAVLLGDRRLEMPGWVEPAMRRIRDEPSFTLGDLSDVLPDPDSRSVLARRLVREGLLRPLP